MRCIFKLPCFPPYLFCRERIWTAEKASVCVHVSLFLYGCVYMCVVVNVCVFVGVSETVSVLTYMRAIFIN